MQNSRPTFLDYAHMTKRIKTASFQVDIYCYKCRLPFVVGGVVGADGVVSEALDVGVTLGEVGITVGEVAFVILPVSKENAN